MPSPSTKGMWTLVRGPEDEHDGQDGEGQGVVVAELVGGGLGLEVELVADGLGVDAEEEERREVVGGEHADLVEGQEEAEGDLLHQQDDEEVGLAQVEEVLEELAQREDAGEDLEEGGAGGDGQPGDEQHVEEEVEEGPVEDAHLVGGEAGAALELGW
jgi:hypothetical protein